MKNISNYILPSDFNRYARNEHPSAISGSARICDRKTGKCYSVNDGKAGETPPIKKEEKKPNKAK